MNLKLCLGPLKHENEDGAVEKSLGNRLISIDGGLSTMSDYHRAASSVFFFIRSCHSVSLAMVVILASHVDALVNLDKKSGKGSR